MGGLRHHLLCSTYDRPETPHSGTTAIGGTFTSAVREEKQFCRHNRIYTSRSMRGPFAPPSRSEIKLPDDRWFYIAKVLTDPQGRNVLLAAIGGDTMSRPYPVTYEADGSLTLGIPVQPSHP